jgi:hypothetical protein
VHSKSKKDVCPIFIGENLYFTEKNTLTPQEGKYGLTEGERILVFDNTIIGKFAVLLCKDAVAPRLFEDLCRAHQDLDFVFVPSMQEKNSSENQHKSCNDYCGRYGKSYIFYCNNYLIDKWEGKSAIFGEHVESEIGGETHQPFKGAPSYWRRLASNLAVA